MNIRAALLIAFCLATVPEFVHAGMIGALLDVKGLAGSNFGFQQTDLLLEFTFDDADLAGDNQLTANEVTIVQFHMSGTYGPHPSPTAADWTNSVGDVVFDIDARRVSALNATTDVNSVFVPIFPGSTIATSQLIIPDFADFSFRNTYQSGAAPPTYLSAEVRANYLLRQFDGSDQTLDLLGNTFPGLSSWSFRRVASASAPVPEPGATALWGLGLIGLAGSSLRRRKTIAGPKMR
jgi:hypothetical protein